MDSEKGYKPCPIPPRDTIDYHNTHSEGSRSDSASQEPGFDSFVELNISDDNDELYNRDLFPAAHTIVSHLTPPPEQLAEKFDRIQARFSDMRHIGSQYAWEDRDRTEVFYKQALFMADFTDNYPGNAPFKRYFPQYHDMTYEQLRTYFTWRTRVRVGDIVEAPLSYAFLYLFELLNNVGVAHPEEGLERLIEFWEAFRAFDPLIDQYVLPWLKDYYVYYPLSKTFESFASSYHLEHEYPTVFCCSTDRANSFDLFSQISSYDITSSIFFTDERKSLISDCFSFVIKQLRESFQTQGKCFEDYVFYTSKIRSLWKPFPKALFYPVLEQPDRIVKLSSLESYECKDGVWMGKTSMLTDSGKQLIGYIMKTMEVQLRRIFSFRYKLSAKPDSFKALDQQALIAPGVPISQIIEESCTEFYKISTHRPVKVDLSNLEHIREELHTNQEKLIVATPEDITHPTYQGPDTHADSDGEAQSSGASHASYDRTPSLASAESTPAIQTQGTIWTELCASLTKIEQEALQVVLDCGDVKRFAQNNGVMPEVLIDGINEKAMDIMGDTILEFDDTAQVFDEYLEDLRGAVESA